MRWRRFRQFCSKPFVVLLCKRWWCRLQRRRGLSFGYHLLLRPNLKYLVENIQVIAQPPVFSLKPGDTGRERGDPSSLSFQSPFYVFGLRGRREAA